MGYWEHGVDGASFTKGSGLVWGDAPADAMDDAISRIVTVFAEDLDRPPTKAEIRAGLEFSLGDGLKE